MYVRACGCARTSPLMLSQIILHADESCFDYFRKQKNYYVCENFNLQFIFPSIPEWHLFKYRLLADRRKFNSAVFDISIVILNAIHTSNDCAPQNDNYTCIHPIKWVDVLA